MNEETDIDELLEKYNEQKNVNEKVEKIMIDRLSKRPDDEEAIILSEIDLPIYQTIFEKEFTIDHHKRTFSNLIKNLKTSIEKIQKKLSFPDEYDKFKKALPDMIKYKKETDKKVFHRGNISKQFLKWYNS